MPSRLCHCIPPDQWTFWRPGATDLIFVHHNCEALSECKDTNNQSSTQMKLYISIPISGHPAHEAKCQAKCEKAKLESSRSQMPCANA